jgi:hypothetical protein
MQLVSNPLNYRSMASEQLANFELRHRPFACDPSKSSSRVEADNTRSTWPVKIEHGKIYACL